MTISCITTQQIVYQPVDVPWSVSKSVLESVSCWLSWAYASRLENWALDGDACEYTYPGGILPIWELWAPSSSTGWLRWVSRQRWCWFYCRQSVSVGRRCNRSFTPPVWLRILCGAILPRKASVCEVLPELSRVSLYPRLHFAMRRRHNSPVLLFSDFGVSLVEPVLCFYYRGAWKPFFGHFRHVQGQVDVGLFQLYQTSLHCHSSRYVENQQEISCCI